MPLINQLRAIQEHLHGLLVAVDAILEEVEAIPRDALNEPLIVDGKCKEITQHALERYRERTGNKHSDSKIIRAITNMIQTSTEMELRPKYRVNELVAHGVKARYFRSTSGLLFVVENDVIVTVHSATADRWRIAHAP